MPGPGNYEFKNMTIGTEARRFSFLRRTRNSMGKLVNLTYDRESWQLLAT